jgi:methylated-DNA-[protein]-cysteine S-methyltransferase
MKKAAAYHYRAYRSPAGLLHLWATSNGIAALRFGRQPPVRNAAVIKSGKGRDHLKAMVRQLDQYFRGRPVKFVYHTDLQSGTRFQKAVWQKLAELPPGQLITYGALAREIKRPKAFRAVGQAVGANPLPIIIPCHRVISSSGDLGGYTGGVALKKKLLRIEGITL